MHEKSGKDYSDDAHVVVGNITSAIGVAVGDNARANVRIEHYHERWRPPSPREVPALPPFYCARPEFVQPICEVLGSLGNGIVALTGLEGIGKTTLSCELARQLESQFSDGVLWGECRGRSGELSDLLGGFLSRLGADRDQLPGYDERVAYLRTMLANRRLLIVFDNLNDSQLNPRSLLSSRGNSSILISTPNRYWGDEMADRAFDVPPLDEVAGEQLLQQVAGSALEKLPVELRNRLFEQSGGLPGLLVDLGRQARRSQRDGLDALKQWAQSVTLDWHDLESLYEFTFGQLDGQARQALEIVGMIANAPFQSALIAAGLPTASADDAAQLLRNLESFSLLDRDVEGRLVARTPIYRFAQKKLIASGRVGKYLQGIADYVIDLLNRLALQEEGESSMLLHAQEVMHHCVETQNWELLHSFTGTKARQKTVSGSVSLWYRSNSVLPEFVGVDFDHATVAESSLTAAKFVGCNFDCVTLATLNVTGARFVGCNFAYTQLLQLDLRGTQFVGCNFDDSHFITIDMRGVQFFDCNFANCIFADVEMQDTEFVECKGIEAIIGGGAT
jgi:hypothetical protein